MATDATSVAGYSSYDPTGSVKIPFVDVANETGGTWTYAVDLNMTSADPLTFTVVGVR